MLGELCTVAKHKHVKKSVWFNHFQIAFKRLYETIFMLNAFFDFRCLWMTSVYLPWLLFVTYCTNAASSVYFYQSSSDRSVWCQTNTNLKGAPCSWLRANEPVVLCVQYVIAEAKSLTTSDLISKSELLISGKIQWLLGCLEWQGSNVQASGTFLLLQLRLMSNYF